MLHALVKKKFPSWFLLVLFLILSGRNKLLWKDVIDTKINSCNTAENLQLDLKRYFSFAHFEMFRNIIVVVDSSPWTWKCINSEAYYHLPQSLSVVSESKFMLSSCSKILKQVSSEFAYSFLREGVSSSVYNCMTSVSGFPENKLSFKMDESGRDQFRYFYHSY